MESSTIAVAPPPAESLLDQKLKAQSTGRGKLGAVFFSLVVMGGVMYAASRLFHDLSRVHLVSSWPFVLLSIALLIALGFEFVNGFHDTANAVATVIYTHSLEPHVAVVWSGLWNLAGVLASSGAVAFGILSLLPIELILQVGSGPGFAMIFALLVSAILWNLSTWWLGLPASSSHTLVGSIIGVGLANQLMNAKTGTSGVDWAQAANVFRALFISPVIGFLCAALLLLALKFVVKHPALYEAPKNDEPPPFPIRAMLILTCTGVSFFHGSNDGQKGMGLIMLILIGTVPTAYALNHTMGYNQVQDFAVVSEQAVRVLDAHAGASISLEDPHSSLTRYIRTRQFTPTVPMAERRMIRQIANEVALYKSLSAVPANQQTNVRNDMYIVSEALRLMKKSNAGNFSESENRVLASYQKEVDNATKFIPTWVKIAVALALGMGTMVGWKRIVITVGEKIGKQQLTYSEGASAELITMGTIFVADKFGLPVSTTHVLSSGVAGTMAANQSGLRLTTIRNIALAWVCTLPAAALLSGLLFWLFRLIA